MRRHETTLECEKFKDFSGSLCEVYMCQGLMIHMFTEFQYVSFFLHSMRLQMALFLDPCVRSSVILSIELSWVLQTKIVDVQLRR